MKSKTMYIYLIIELLLFLLIHELVVDTGSGIWVLCLFIPIVILVMSALIGKKEDQGIFYLIQTLLVLLPSYLVTGSFIKEYIGFYIFVNLFGYFIGHVFRK